MQLPSEQYLGHFPGAELVSPIVCPLGADHRPVVATLENYLDQFGYTSNPLRLSDLFPDLLIARVLKALGREDLTPDQARKLLKPTGLPDITEFGRSVHAGMDALLACARTGRSGRGATLYTTTFPCHNCCRHIIVAGVLRVVYIEPYAKRKAPDLHGDAISIDEIVDSRLPFPFIGVGPRRYFDLFSLKLSTGYPIERKENGKRKDWKRPESSPRMQMQPSTGLYREALAWESVKALLFERSPNVHPEADTSVSWDSNGEELSNSGEDARLGEGFSHQSTQ